MELSSDERQFLKSTLSSFVCGRAAPSPPNVIQWSRLERIIALNAVVTIFLKQIEGAQIPEEQRGRWQQYSVRVLMNNERNIGAAGEVFSILEQNGIPSVGLRGVSLVHSIYSQPHLRPMADIDMLVARSDRGAIIDAMKSAGYSPSGHSFNQLVYHVNGSRLELHWNLLKRLFSFQFDFEPWIATRRGLVSEGREIFVLGDENELIEVICHAFLHHDIDTLLKVVDIALLCNKRDLDWDYIRAWAREGSVLPVFQFTLAFVDHILETSYVELLGDDAGQSWPPESFEPYEKRLFGHDDRTQWLRRLTTSSRLAVGLGGKLRMVLRFARWKDIRKLMQTPFDQRANLGPRSN